MIYTSTHFHLLNVFRTFIYDFVERLYVKMIILLFCLTFKIVLDTESSVQRAPDCCYLCFIYR